ncbi:MAG: hypothetical protein IJ529_06315 [Alphaproteobacteria bacterium]|nr:hypothetical protein [Alphaproteobacteria bacterium]MBQ9236229.1 hypothetical protein [Alphaproteobacteria bacterium]
MSGVEVAAAVAAATATLAEGYSQYQQGKAEKKAYDMNADILRQNAARKRVETSLNEDIVRSQNRKQLAKARAAFGEAGMITSATTTGVLGQMAGEQEQNAFNLRYAGESEAANYMNQAALQDYYGRSAKANGKNAWKMSMIKAPINAFAAYASAGGFSSEATVDATGQGVSGGNVFFTNASYMG